MGNTLKYNENYPPPFHLNVNRIMLTDQTYYNNYNKNLTNKIGNNSKIQNSYLYPLDQNIFQQPPKNNKNKSKEKLKYKESFELNNNIEEEHKEKNKTKKKSKDKKKLEDQGDMSIDIDIINKNNVNIKIPLNKKKVWQKKYNKSEFIGTVINDYKIENKLDLPKDYFNGLRYFNKPVSLEDKISSLLTEDDEKEEDLEQKLNLNEENKNIDLSHINEKYTDVIGKPFFDPFAILCFYKSQKKFMTLNYNRDLVEKMKINNCDITSAYCNGWNHLYISGGEKCINKFWDINLKKNIIHEPLQILPKKYHSMIFIPKAIVFIVGGNNLDTFYYNLKEQKIYNWGKLNIIRIEPALQIIKNKLYCIDSINSINDKNNYTLEMTDLTSNEGRWKLIKPKLSYNVMNTTFCQQSFGICKDKDDNIIFLGGKFNNNENDLSINDNWNFMYNIINNTIGLSQVKYQEFKLKEKGFCPFNKSYDYVLTDFPRKSPQIAFFNKKKGKIELINFSPDDNSNNSNQNGKSPKIGQNNENEKNIKMDLNNNVNNISPIFSFGEKNNQNDNNIEKHEEKAFDVNRTLSGSRNPNNKYRNNIKPVNDNKLNNNLNKINYENKYIRQTTPQFVNEEKKSDINEKNKNIINQTTILNNRNTVGNISKTPDKNMYHLKKIIIPNLQTTKINHEQRNAGNSFDLGQRYYYPRIGINYYNRNTNNNIYNQYYLKKYY